MLEATMAEPNDDDILDAPAAAKFLGVAVATLAKMRCLGGSPAFIKAGRKVLYRRRDLVDWLNARLVRNTTEASQLVPCRITDALPMFPRNNASSENKS
jgi:hypothetical protein